MTYFADWDPALFYLVVVPAAALALIGACSVGMWLVDRVFDWMNQ